MARSPDRTHVARGEEAYCKERGDPRSGRVDRSGHRATTGGARPRRCIPAVASIGGSWGSLMPSSCPRVGQTQRGDRRRTWNREQFCSALRQEQLNNALPLLIRPGKKLVFPDIIPADESHPNHGSPWQGSFRFPGRLRIRSLRLFGDRRSFSPVPNEQMAKK